MRKIQVKSTSESPLCAIHYAPSSNQVYFLVESDFDNKIYNLQQFLTTIHSYGSIDKFTDKLSEALGKLFTADGLKLKEARKMIKPLFQLRKAIQKLEILPDNCSIVFEDKIDQVGLNPNTLLRQIDEEGCVRLYLEKLDEAIKILMIHSDSYFYSDVKDHAYVLFQLLDAVRDLKYLQNGLAD